MSWLTDLISQFVETDHSQVINDLENWEEEEHQLLPNGMSAQTIADLEADGFIVDLVTGELFANPDDVED